MSRHERVWKDLTRVRDQAPLVHNITNFVVMNSTANALLAVGASPIMAHAPEEMRDLIGIANALVLNIGTLSRPWIESMHLAGKAAGERGVPVILDPVGAGASRLRTETSISLLDSVRPAVIRGNGSEILALATASSGGTKGVDSLHRSDQVTDVARELALNRDCIVVVSGATDIVTDGDRIVRVAGGDPLMLRVTGLGCTASALVGAFAAVSDSTFDASVSGMAVMSVAGSMAAEKAEGPGTLQLHLYDALHNMGRDDLERRIKID